MSAFDIFKYDPGLNELRETSKADKVRDDLASKYQLIPMWLSFSTGVELLAKSVLIKYNVLSIEKKKRTDKHKLLIKNVSNYQSAKLVYDFINLAFIKYDDHELSPFEWSCVNVDLAHIYNINMGTLGTVITDLKKLKSNGILSPDQYGELVNALQVLSDIRRNVDAHTFYGLTVGKSINGDLENLYLPAINLLLRL